MSAGERCQENGKLPRRQLKLRAIVCHGLPWFAIACECLFCLIFGAHRWNSQVKWNSRILLSFGPYNDKLKEVSHWFGDTFFQFSPASQALTSSFASQPAYLFIILTYFECNESNRIESNGIDSLRFESTLCASRRKCFMEWFIIRQGPIWIRWLRGRGQGLGHKTWPLICCYFCWSYLARRSEGTRQIDC